MAGPLGTSIRVYRPKSGHQDAASLKKRKEASKYKVVSSELQRRGLPTAKVVPQKLMQIVADMRAFLDTHFGRDSEHAKIDLDKTMAIFPASLFRDFSEDSPLVTILSTVFSYASENGFDPDFSETGDRDKCFALLEHVQKVLKESNHIPTVKAYLSPKLAERETKKLLEALLRHGAAILSSPHVATHIIYPDPPGSRESQTDDQVLCRMLATTAQGGEEECFIHWMHHPDSYDDWIPRDEVLGHLYSPVRRNVADPWHISARWVRDLELYNEWMNELDYEMPGGFNEYIGRPPTDPGEARLISKYSRVRLRLRKPAEEKPLDEEEDFGMVGLPSIVAHPPSAEGNGLDPIGGNMVVEEELLEGEQRGGEMESSGDEQTEGNDGNGKVPVAEGVFMPAFATWFDANAVHEIERRALSEFFSGTFASKSEKAYRDIRNFMIRTWRRSKSYLSGTAARRHLAGDACAILRVHGFLEHWGLINYGCDDAQQGYFNPPPKALPLNAGIEDELSVRNNHILLLDNGTRAELKDLKIIKQDTNGEPLGEAGPGNFLIRDSERTDHSEIGDVQMREPIEYHCDSCGIDCSKLRFHCATKADVDLCATCYKHGRYSSTMKHRDFIQMTSAGQFGGPEEVDPDVWTESETLLLLEALEMYSDNWQLVSEHVGSKGKNQCVTHFLRLPIEDAFLNITRRRWWGERPADEEGFESPTQIMRTAGARESSLLAATAKGPTAKTYTGQPLVFGDQISTIVPFVSILTNQSSPSMLRELTGVMDFDAPRRKVLRPFVQLMKNRSEVNKDDDERDEGSDFPLASAAVSKALILSDQVYQEISRGVKYPQNVLKSEYGQEISKAALSLQKHGSLNAEDVARLQFEKSALNIHNGAGAEAAGSNGHATPSDGSESPSPEGPQKAIATVALAAACVTAAQKRAAEEAELDRLLSVALEIRLVFIRRKLAHLGKLTQHVDLSASVRKRRRLESAGVALRRKLTRPERRDFARPRELVKSVEGAGVVPALSIWSLDGAVEQACTWTEKGWAQAERQKTSLPRFEAVVNSQACAEATAKAGAEAKRDGHGGDGGDPGDVEMPDAPAADAPPVDGPPPVDGTPAFDAPPAVDAPPAEAT